MDELNKRLEEQNIVLDIDDEVYDKIVRDGSDVAYGARPMRRYIQREIENPLAVKILSMNTSGYDEIHFHLHLVNDEIVIE